jgi:pseudaminic acid biosynthesis-associated methylase
MTATGPAQAPTEQLALWQSEFGRAYTDRNDRDNLARVDSLRRVVGDLDPASVLEVGCNAGWNLTYLSRLGFTGLHGIEPQRYALDRARERLGDAAVLQLGNAFALPFGDAAHDLVFTSGVLIHIDPVDLPRAIDEIYRVARRWIAVIEYDHPDEVEVSYRGHAGALWKRDHGACFRARYPQLREIRTLPLSAQDGYDDCTAHVFAKPERTP